MRQLIEKLDAQPRSTKGTVLLTTLEWDQIKSEIERLRQFEPSPHPDGHDLNG